MLVPFEQILLRARKNRYAVGAFNVYTLEGVLAAEMGDLSSIEGISAEQAKSLWYAAEAAYIKEHGEITE